MKPAQESLPPKKRDLPVNSNNNTTTSSSSSSTSGAGSGPATATAATGGGGGEETASTQNATASSDVQSSSSGDWLRVQQQNLQQSLQQQQQQQHYSVEGAPDQYSMLYKVALPSVTYSPTSLHPAMLSHISPAYTVPSSLLQHAAGLSYPPLGYTPIPHSSVQFVGSPYAAVPYAVPPGFIPAGPLISPQSALSQSHGVPHLVPYPSVIQEGVVSSPPQTQVPVHAYAKVAAAAATAGGVPLVLSSEQAVAAAAAAAQQQQQQQPGVLSAAELSPRGVPVFYHPARPHASREALEQERERERDRERELNGGEREQQHHGAPGRELLLQDSAAHAPRNARLLLAAASAQQQHQLEAQQEREREPRGPKSRRPDERASPGQRSTPDMDLEVQQVVGRLASPVQHAGNRKEASSHVPLNLSQNSQQSREAHGGEGRTVYVHQPPIATVTDLRAQAHAQTALQAQPGHHAVILANGQPVLIPLDYHRHAHPHPQPQTQQQQYAVGQPNDSSTPAVAAPLPPHTAAITAQSPYHKAMEHLVSTGHPDRTGPPEIQIQLQQQPPPQTLAAAHMVPGAVALAPVSLPVQAQGQGQQAQVLGPQGPVQAAAAAAAATGPSHFMKGAIIQLATGELKRVEDLQTQDFVRSAEMSGGLKIDSSMVVDVRASQQRPGLVSLHFSVGEQQSKVTIDVPPEHPFFVFGQGWSSCSPERTAQLYGLACHHLQVGDVCVSIALQQPPAAAQQQKVQPQQQIQEQQQQQQQPLQSHSQPQQQHQQLVHVRTPTKSNSTSSAAASALVQPMGPPAPQHTRPHSQSHFRIQRERDRERERERDRDRDRDRERERERERERVEKDDVVHVGMLGHEALPPRPNRTSAEHPRSHSSYYLHTEGHSRHELPGGGGGGGSVSGLSLTSSSSMAAAQRRWSAPTSQRYAIKGGEDGGPGHGRLLGPPSALPPGPPSRPSFIPQEVKLSIEGRSNAGK